MSVDIIKIWFRIFICPSVIFFPDIFATITSIYKQILAMAGYYACGAFIYLGYSHVIHLSVTSLDSIVWNVVDRLSMSHNIVWNVNYRLSMSHRIVRNIVDRLSMFHRSVWNVVDRLSMSHSIVWNVVDRLSMFHRSVWNVADRLSMSHSIVWNVVDRLSISHKHTRQLAISQLCIPSVLYPGQF